MPNALSGQAWAPPAGVGSVTLLFQHVDHTGHRLDDGSFFPGYESESRVALVQLDYALTDRLSFSLGVPYVGARYTGDEPSFFGLPVDECRCWQTGWQDLNVTLRYNLLNDSLAVSPSISYGTPLRSYEYFGEAVVGRSLDELRLAVDIGKRLDAISPKLSISGRYSYAFVEEVLGLPNDRSNASLSLGYQLTPRFSASADAYWQHSHGGLRSSEFVTDEQWSQYDRLLRDQSFHLGATFAYSFDRFDLFASYIDFTDGKDTHTGRAISFGVSWPFVR